MNKAITTNVKIIKIKDAIFLSVKLLYCWKIRFENTWYDLVDFWEEKKYFS